MADSGALRARRHRLHAAGNHSLCKRSCGQNHEVAAAFTKMPEVPAGSGEIAGLDPRLAMVDLAAQLREACAASPGDAVLAREYRLTLMELAKGGDGGKPDPFAELLAGLSGPMPAEVGDSAH